MTENLDSALKALDESIGIDVLARLEALPDSPDLAEVESLLRALPDCLKGADSLAMELAKERAAKALKGKVRAPVSMISAALTSNDSTDKEDNLQGRAVVLSDPEPWPDPVDGAELLDSVARALGRFVAMPEGAATAVSLWIVHAHSLDAWFLSAILALVSPVKRCGKTTLLQVIGALVPRPLHASNITPAVVFRAVEKFAPTLLVDEADTFLRANDELRGVLNSGHTKSTAFVVRTDGDDYEPRLFSTWCAKAVALIGKLPDTLEDRSITISMRRRAPEEQIERLRLDRLEGLEEIRSRGARWAADNEDVLRELDPEMPVELDDRAADNWRPLLAIADLAKGGWPEKARRAARLLSGSEEGEDSSIRVQLLCDIQDSFDERGVDRVFSDVLLGDLHKLQDRPWGEWGRSRKAMTRHALARMLKPFDVRPREVRMGDEHRKGYLLAHFEDAFARYLPSRPRQPRQTNGDGALGDIPDRDTEPGVALAKSLARPISTGVVADVAVQEGIESGEWGEV